MDFPNFFQGSGHSSGYFGLPYAFRPPWLPFNQSPFPHASPQHYFYPNGYSMPAAMQNLPVPNKASRRRRRKQCQQQWESTDIHTWPNQQWSYFWDNNSFPLNSEIASRGPTGPSFDPEEPFMYDDEDEEGDETSTWKMNRAPRFRRNPWNWHRRAAKQAESSNGQCKSKRKRRSYKRSFDSCKYSRQKSDRPGDEEPSQDEDSDESDEMSSFDESTNEQPEHTPSASLALSKHVHRVSPVASMEWYQQARQMASCSKIEAVLTDQSLDKASDNDEGVMKEEANGKCQICRESMNNPATLESCFHRFCFDCIVSRSEWNTECPSCDVTFSRLYYDIQDIQNFKTFAVRPLDRQPSEKEPEHEEECSICLEVPVNVAALEGCLHRFCFECIRDWTKKSNKCPLCNLQYSAIRHNMRGDHTHDVYRVEAPDGLNLLQMGLQEREPVAHFPPAMQDFPLSSLAQRYYNGERELNPQVNRKQDRGNGGDAGTAQGFFSRWNLS